MVRVIQHVEVLPRPPPPQSDTALAGEVEERDQKFKLMLGCTASLKPA